MDPWNIFKILPFLSSHPFCCPWRVLRMLRKVVVKLLGTLKYLKRRWSGWLFGESFMCLIWYLPVGDLRKIQGSLQPWIASCYVLIFWNWSVSFNWYCEIFCIYLEVMEDLVWPDHRLRPRLRKTEISASLLPHQKESKQTQNTNLQFLN